jgi:hypothetical protein
LLLAADLLHYIREVAYRPIKVVVDHDVGRELETLRLLHPAEGHATFDVLLGVAPRPEPLLLNLARGGTDQHAVGVRAPPEHLAGALDVDLQHDVATLRGLGRGCPVVLTEERRPFEEAALGDARQEAILVDEGVGILRLAWATGAGGP